MRVDFDFVNRPDLAVLTGSRLYGTQRYNADGTIASDIDIRGFVIPPPSIALGLFEGVFESKDEWDLQGDHKIWSFKKMINMLIKGNAQALECLFVPKTHLIRVSELGKEILRMRSQFVSKVFFSSITGFSYSEWQKVRGVKEEPILMSSNERRAKDAFRDAFKHLPKEKWDEILRIAYSEHKKETVDAKGDVGKKRREEYTKYGYSVSCAVHALRLMAQCIELLKTGEMIFPRPEAAFLSKVKRGEVELAEVEALYADLRFQADDALINSKLPEKTDPVPLWDFWRKVTLDNAKQFFASK